MNIIKKIIIFLIHVKNKMNKNQERKGVKNYHFNPIFKKKYIILILAKIDQEDGKG